MTAQLGPAVSPALPWGVGRKFTELPRGLLSTLGRAWLLHAAWAQGQKARSPRASPDPTEVHQACELGVQNLTSCLLIPCCPLLSGTHTTFFVLLSLPCLLHFLHHRPLQLLGLASLYPYSVLSSCFSEAPFLQWKS